MKIFSSTKKGSRSTSIDIKTKFSIEVKAEPTCTMNVSDMSEKDRKELLSLLLKKADPT